MNERDVVMIRIYLSEHEGRRPGCCRCCTMISK
jgi:hypothetical protein